MQDLIKNNLIWSEGQYQLYEDESSLFLFRNKDCIRFSQTHKVYVKDLKNHFDLYHGAVQSIPYHGYNLVDYSQPTLHHVIGFELFPIKIPSFLESLDATYQYIEFAQLSADSIVLDLGSYAGLSAILFDLSIAKQTNSNTRQKHGGGVNSRVITVEADKKNLPHIKYNLAEYTKTTGRIIELFHTAVWNSDGFIDFASEGHLASSVNNVYLQRGTCTRVQTHCLSSLAKHYALEKVDFIKCDIEGAEVEMVQDHTFFEQYNPRIIIEAHYRSKEKQFSTERVMAQLSQYGYNCNLIEQDGFSLPLITCVR